jgi:hypothetical protein
MSDKDAPSVTDEPWGLLASFETACHDQAGWQLMATERQALSDRRALTLRFARESLQGQPGDGVGQRRG